MGYIREYPPPPPPELHVTDRRAQLRSVTEIALRSPFLCVNGSLMRYDFRAGACAKATRYGVKTYPTCDSSL